MTKVIVAGATGLVGSTIINILEERNFPLSEIKFLASKDSAGEKISFKGQDIEIRELKPEEFNGFDLAFFALDGSLSKIYAEEAKTRGVKVVDNSSYFRMEEGVPLVVPEVNPDAIKAGDYIIANPNCSTIQCIAPLYQLEKTYGLERVIFSTYQSVSGSGKEALLDLENGTTKVYPYPIKDNILPHIDSFLDDGYTKEEMKMINETRKILGLPDLKVTATTVRVPVPYSHCVSINVELKKDFDLKDVRELFNDKLGMVLVDDPKNNIYPQPLDAAGRDEIFVGRIRRDYSRENALNIFVVADNIRKGAALNAVQIGEILVD